MTDIATTLLQKLDPETAHRLSIRALGFGLHPRMTQNYFSSLNTSLMGLEFPNPFCIAAGFDKHGEAIAAFHKMGMGFAEIGSVTPEPQEGNPKPRVFRFPEHQAVVNRYGFNSEGMDAVAARLAKWQGMGRSGILGVNLGKNKLTENAVDDYLLGAEKFAPFADYIVVNVSSPNTPGLRGEQSPERLRPLLEAVQSVLDGTPLVLKVAPDLTDEDISDISAVAIETKLSALIVSNTTMSRPNDIGAAEAGGLSGAPLFDLSTEALRKFARQLKGQIPLIGAGGVDSAEAAYAKIRAGASLIQLYSALVYQGHGLIQDLHRDLAHFLKRDGFEQVSDAVGVDV